MDWRGVAVAILALCVGVAYAVALILALLHPDRLTLGSSALLYTMGGALVGGVIAYVGGRPKGGNDDE